MADDKVQTRTEWVMAKIVREHQKDITREPMEKSLFSTVKDGEAQLTSNKGLRVQMKHYSIGAQHGVDEDVITMEVIPESFHIDSEGFLVVEVINPLE